MEKIKLNESWLQKNGMYKCPYCSKEYKKRGIIHHIYRNHTERKFSSGFHGKYNDDEYRKKLSLSTTNHYKKINGEIKEFQIKCFKCNKEFIVEEPEKKFPIKKKYFCCRSCANSRTFTKKDKKNLSEKVSKAIKEKWNDENYSKRVLKNNRCFTSKNERLIRDYFIKEYPEDEWTFGGNLKYNETRIVRDLYSNKLKVCFEYDGIWHFEKVHKNHNLIKKQKVDKALLDYCKENNFRLIRISETFFKNNENIFDILEKYIYNDKQDLILLGDEYKIN